MPYRFIVLLDLTTHGVRPVVIIEFSRATTLLPTPYPGGAPHAPAGPAADRHCPPAPFWSNSRKSECKRHASPLKAQKRAVFATSRPLNPARGHGRWGLFPTSADKAPKPLCAPR